MKYKKSTSALRLGVLQASVLLALSPAAFAQSSSDVSTLDKVEVTGSRIKRADIEGAAPVTVIDRATIDASGHVSVADLMRDSTFGSFGNLRPQSGSSAQAVSTIDLRGLGADRTLVLIDGRRAPSAPSTGLSADLNTIPLAAVERIEVLSDGASALYGSDAIGGVVNVILRKDYEGVEVRYGKGLTKVKGGDTEEASVLFGLNSDRGNLLLGASYSTRGMVYTRDQIGAKIKGASIYGNNFFYEDGSPGGALPGYKCDDPGFYTLGNNCVYNHKETAANEASVKNKSLFARGQWQINDNWSIYANASYSDSDSFGRYAPTPGVVYVAEGSPNDPKPGDGQGAYIYHRYAGAGNRDTTVDNSVTDLAVGLQWQASERLAVDFGLRRSDAKFKETGRGYVVTPLAELAIANGRYDLRNPYANPDVIKSFTATIGRDGKYEIEQLFADATLDLFEMGGGKSVLAFGLEHRKETYADLYDSLSEAGVIAGSAGNSAKGDRNVSSAYAEWLFPITGNFDITAAARYDRYNDYGNDVSPKLSMRWQPLDRLTFRASAGEGFRAPPLTDLYAARSFSAEAVKDYRTCVGIGFTSAQCGGDSNGDHIADGAEDKAVGSYQVDSYSSGNTNLKSENSKQYSVGMAWDATDWLNLTVDFYQIKIDDRIRLISYQELVDFDNRGIALPAGTSVSRRPNGAVREVNTAYANEGDLDTRGVDISLRTRFELGDAGQLTNWLQVSRVIDYTVTDGLVKKDRLGWVGQPDTRASLRNTWTNGDFSINWNINYIGDQQNPAVRPSYGFLGGDPNTRIGGYATNDVSFNVSTPWNANVTLGVNNIGNRYPELVNVDGRPWNFDLYDAYGRTVYFRYAQKF